MSIYLAIISGLVLIFSSF